MEKRTRFTKKSDQHLQRTPHAGSHNSEEFSVHEFRSRFVTKV